MASTYGGKSGKAVKPLQNYDSKPKSKEIPGILPGLEFLEETESIYMFIDSEWLEAYINVKEPDDDSKPELTAHTVYPLSSNRLVSCMRKFFLYMCRFKVRILDSDNNLIFYVDRKVSSCKYWLGWLCFCGSFGNRISVHDLNHKLMGTIVQYPTCPGRFKITDDKGMIIFKIKGSCLCEFSLCCFRPKATYEVTSKGKHIGYIKKVNTGIYNDILTTNRVFTVNFPVTLPYEHKNLIMCSVFLLNFIYYQK